MSAVCQMQKAWVGWSLDPEVISRNAAIEETMQAIQQLERQAADARSYLNSLLPTGKIPDDVWIEIFVHFVSSTMVDDVDDSALNHPWSVSNRYSEWFRLVYVCRRWKDLIYNTPQL